MKLASPNEVSPNKKKFRPKKKFHQTKIKKVSPKPILPTKKFHPQKRKVSQKKKVFAKKQVSLFTRQKKVSPKKKKRNILWRINLAN